MNQLIVASAGKLKKIKQKIPVPSADEIRIKIACVGVCRSDLEVFYSRRAHKIVRDLWVVGHEMSGIIDAVGSNISNLKIGDHVTTDSVWGCLADYVITKPINVLKIPKKIPLQDACLIEVLPGIMMTALKTGINKHSDVVVIGQGLSGLIITRVLHLHGCNQIIVVDPCQKKLEISSSFGATKVFQGHLQEVLNDIKSQLPSGAHFLINASYDAECIQKSLPILKNRARIIPYGGLSENMSINMLKFHHKSISIIKESEGINGIHEARKLWKEGLELVKDDLLPLHMLRTHTFPMSEAQSAFELRENSNEFSIHVVLENSWVNEYQSSF